MGKKSRRAVATPPVANATTTTTTATATPAEGGFAVVGGREPCPCGSGKRYKACHGRPSRRAEAAFVARPFEHLPGECDLVALREIVPAATATGRTSAAYGGVAVTFATVLPMAWPAMRRADGEVRVGLQTAAAGADPSRDLAGALIAALAAEPGSPVPGNATTASGPRLQEVLDPDEPFTVTVHGGFDFWLDGVQDVPAEVRESMERANTAVVPTVRLTSVEAAYWCRIGERRHLRWVLPQPEDDLLDALARLHAARSSAVAGGARYVGAFRAHGLLVPVWDLASDTEAADLESPALAFLARLEEALASTAPLSIDERRARAGVASRQLTLR
jgi:drug/metabolite transporter superfamily protein YnfA